MPDRQITERRLRPLKDAISDGRWKQALSLCEKWEKRGENSDLFYILKAVVLINQSDEAHRAHATSLTLQLCRRNPAVTDLEVIHQIQMVLKDLALNGDEGVSVWTRASAAHTEKKELLTAWLNHSISERNWLSAQKCVMTLRKAFPEDHRYEFWNILMCLFVQRDPMTKEKDRELFSSLAYRLISRVAEVDHGNQHTLLPSEKGIKTSEELYLLIRIYLGTGHIDGAIKILKCVTLDNEISRFSEQDPYLLESMLLDALEKYQEWNEVFAMVQQLLLNDSGRNLLCQKERAFRLLVGKELILSSETLHQGCASIIKAALNTQPASRAARLAWLEYVQNAAHWQHQDQQRELLDACLAHYKTYGTKTVCFEDLKRPLSRLSDENFTTFFSVTSSNSPEGQCLLFCLLIEYHFIISPRSEPTELSHFAVKAYRSYVVSSSHGYQLPEAALLAVAAALNLAMICDNGRLCITALMLLEASQVKSREFYPLLLMLLRTQLKAGLGSLAIETFAELNIKNLQWETVGHVLLTRIPTLRPGKHNQVEPAHDLRKTYTTALEVLEDADRSLVNGFLNGLETGSYSNVVDCDETRLDIARSINRQILLVGKRKVERLRGLPEHMILQSSHWNLVDNRDFSFMPKIEQSKDIPESYLQLGPFPKSKWLQAMVMYDHIVTYVQATLTTQPMLADKALLALKTTLTQIEESREPLSSELTSAENRNFVCHLALAKAIALLDGKKPSQQRVFDVFIKNIEECLDGMKTVSAWDGESALTVRLAENLEAPTWAYFHFCFTWLETLQALSLFLEAMSKRTMKKEAKAIAFSNVQIREMRNCISGLEGAILEHARKLKEGLNAPGVLGCLIDAGLGRKGDGEGDAISALGEMIEKICGVSSLEVLCGKIKDSWEDALDCVLAVRIRSFN